MRNPGIRPLGWSQEAWDDNNAWLNMRDMIMGRIAAGAATPGDYEYMMPKGGGGGSSNFGDATNAAYNQGVFELEKGRQRNEAEGAITGLKNAGALQDRQLQERGATQRSKILAQSGAYEGGQKGVSSYMNQGLQNQGNFQQDQYKAYLAQLQRDEDERRRREAMAWYNRQNNANR